VQTIPAFLAGAAAALAATGLWRGLCRRRNRARAEGPDRLPTTAPQGEADRALKQSEENFRQFFDTTDDFLFVLDEQGRILKVNRTVTVRLGYSEDELRGRLAQSLHPEADQARAMVMMAALLSGAVDHCPLPIEAHDGTVIPVETRTVRGSWDGRPVIFGICKDIAGLRISEEKFAKAFHGSPALMTLIDLGTLTVYDVNQAFLDVLGYSRAAVIGKRPTELNLFADLKQRDALVDALLHGRPPRNVEVQLRTRHGHIRDGLVSTETLSLSRESLILAVVVDITERKRVEAALRLTAAELERRNQELAVARDAALDAARVKSQFLANMSHEIRTPLNGMLGLAELLSRSPLSSDQQEYVDSITRCGDLLLSILNTILDYSKLEAGRLQIEAIPFDLHAVVFDVVEFYGTKASPADVELVVDLDPALPSGFLGDPGRLRQVLGNLVSNAVKFTAKGHILIEAKQVSRDGGKAVLSIAISDTGEGIPEEAQGRLFQPFTQADASTSRKHGGTGLGLALSKRIVEGMGGQIVLQSQPEQGATLTVTLALPINEKASPPSTAALTGKLCLVVDDSALVRAALATQLCGLGAEVCTVASEQEAIALAGASPAGGRAFDLALIDLYMPGLGGERLAQVLRSAPRFGDTGIVMLTPLVLRPDSPEEPSLVAETCDGYLVKPARSELVAKVLGLVLENKRAGRSGILVTRHTVSPPKSNVPDADTLPFPLRVLLAEDNEVNQLVARRMLEEVGATVTVAVDGHQAVAAIELGSFDLVVMDCQMPGLDGFSATARIRAAEESKGGHLPILAVTANSLVGDAERCLAAGMDGYLSKPYGRTELLREIVRLTQACGPGAGQAPAVASKPNLDRARFRDMAQLLGSASSDSHGMLLQSFERNTEKRIQDLSRAIENRDAEAAYGVAHAIKGSSGNLGFVGLEQLAAQIERMARDGQLQALSGEVQAMVDELGRVRTFLQSYFRQTAA
jgi:PAS domain S-box-containing protein